MCYRGSRRSTHLTLVWGSLSGPVEYTGLVKPAQDTFGILNIRNIEEKREGASQSFHLQCHPSLNNCYPEAADTFLLSNNG